MRYNFCALSLLRVFLNAEVSVTRSCSHDVINQNHVYVAKFKLILQLTFISDEQVCEYVLMYL